MRTHRRVGVYSYVAVGSLIDACGCVRKGRVDPVCKRGMDRCQPIFGMQVTHRQDPKEWTVEREGAKKKERERERERERLSMKTNKQR